MSERLELLQPFGSEICSDPEPISNFLFAGCPHKNSPVPNLIYLWNELARGQVGPALNVPPPAVAIKRPSLSYYNTRCFQTLLGFKHQGAEMRVPIKFSTIGATRSTSSAHMQSWCMFPELSISFRPLSPHQRCLGTNLASGGWCLPPCGDVRTIRSAHMGNAKLCGQTSTK